MVMRASNLAFRLPTQPALPKHLLQATSPPASLCYLPQPTLVLTAAGGEHSHRSCPTLSCTRLCYLSAKGAVWNRNRPAEARAKIRDPPGEREHQIMPATKGWKSLQIFILGKRDYGKPLQSPLSEGLPED